MENQNISVVITARANLDKQSSAQIVIKKIPEAMQIMRGLKALGICWVIALLCILVPILHFVLVPLFLVVGAFMFFQQMSIKVYLVEGKFNCPSCNAEIILKPAPFDWPKREICEACRADLSLNPKT